MAGVGGSAILVVFSNTDPLTPWPHLRRRFPMVIRIIRSTICCWGLALGVFLSSGLGARADVPTDPAARAKIIGTPKSLQVLPAKLRLSGPRATAQPVVNGLYADGTVRDLTHLA